MDQEQRLDTAHKTLLNRKRQLLHRRNETLIAQNQLLEPDLRDPGDRGVDQSAAILDALVEAELVELRAIKGALHRIDAGTYGICVSCGGPIEEQRLSLLPATAHCRDCSAMN
jgi:RNA polymerase-binding transcription factor DksA